MTNTEQVGSGKLATAITAWHEERYEMGDEMPAGFEFLDSGSQRTVYLHRPTRTVYKVGDQSANREENRVFKALRERGLDHAPACSLWRVTYTSYWGCAYGGEPERVESFTIAMPYLPEDGSVPHDGVLLEGAGDFNADNVHANGGRLWLIDAGGM